MALTVFYQVKRLLDLGCALRNTVFLQVTSKGPADRARSRRVSNTNYSKILGENCDHARRSRQLEGMARFANPFGGD